MPSSHELIPRGPDPNDLEQALRRLRPAAAGLDQAQTLYRAGHAAALAQRPWSSRCGWLVPLAAGVLGLVLGLVAGERTRPGPAVVERIVSVDRPAPVGRTAAQARSTADPAPEFPAPGGVPRSPAERLAWQLVRYGLDGLPGPAAGASGTPLAGAARPPRDLAAGALLQQELEQLRNPGDGL